MDMAKVLCVDDSVEIQDAVVAALDPVGISVVSAASLSEAVTKLTKEFCDLVIIDIGLPDGDGFELCSRIRRTPELANIPIIFLTGRDDVGSKVMAYNMGVDGYVVKPFHFIELRARVENRLKKYLSTRSSSDRVNAGPFVLEGSSQRVKIKGESSFIALTPKEFKILFLLTRYPDQIFSREQILDKILGSNVHVIDRTVDAHICYLRKKLGRYSGTIEAVAGVGYRFNPHLEPVQGVS